MFTTQGSENYSKKDESEYWLYYEQKYLDDFT